MIRKVLSAVLPVILFSGVLNADGSYSAGYRILEIETGERAMNVAVWYPSNSREREFDYKHSDRNTKTKLAVNGDIAEGKKFPLVIFSHGFGGCGHGSHWIKEEMARNGIISASPDYNDKMNVCRIKDTKEVTMEIKLKLVAEAKKVVETLKKDRDSFAYRPKEAKALIDAIERLVKERKIFFADRVDLKKIGAGGHSLGAFTSLSIAGGWKEYSAPRIKSAVLLSVGSYFNDSELQSVKLPVLFMAGSIEEDRAEAAKEMYENVRGIKFVAVVKNANHFTFGDPDVLTLLTEEEIYKMAKGISDYVTCFFKYTLENDPQSLSSLQKPCPSFTEYKFDLSCKE